MGMTGESLHVIMNVDGRDVQYVIALDKATGKTARKTTRSADYSKVPVNQRKAYCTPTLIRWKGGHQLASPAAQASRRMMPSGKQT